MQAELRQALELLRHADLHVMAGNALVIGDGLVVDQRAVVGSATATTTRPARLPSGVPLT